MTDLAFRTAFETAESVRRREVSPVELLDAAIAQIDAVDSEVHAFVTVDREGARRAAEAAEEWLLQGHDVGPLHGVPFSVKDLIDVAGMPTSRGCAPLPTESVEQDAPVVALARRAGGICIGKTSLPELGWGYATQSPLTGTTRNPRDVRRTAGGSSGGAAAALAAGMGALAIGTDGGGSVRQPAAYNGVVGFKPSAGLVPIYPPTRTGAIGHYGPMARTVDDVVLLLDAIAGADSRVTGSTDRSFHALSRGGVQGWRIAYAPTVNGHRVDDEVADIIVRRAERLVDAGATVEQIDLNVDGIEQVWDALYLSAIFDTFKQLDSTDSTYSDDFLEFIEEARALPPKACRDAELRRHDLNRTLWNQIGSFDLVVMPTTSTVAFDADALAPDVVGGQARHGRDWVRLTQVWNLSGQPAISVPVGTAHGLPVGMQLIGPLGADARVLRAARTLEKIG